VKISWSALFNFVGIFIVLFVIAGLQTTFWYQLFGNVPAPLLWLNLIIYLILYRKPLPAILTVYAAGLLLLSFTGMPLKMMWSTLMILFALVYAIKSRVFWSGSGYYTIMCAFSAIAYHIIYVLVSYLVESNPVSFEIVDRLVQIVLTPSFAFPLYWVLAKLDKMTQDELMHESGGVEL
jgi:hypothetical protein